MIQASIIFEKELQNSGAKLSIGPHEKVTFYGLVKNGDYFDLSFGKDGQSIHKRLFKPTGAQPLEGETPSQALAREQLRNIRLVTHALSQIVEEEVFLAFTGKDYEDFMNKASILLTSYKGSFVNLLVVPNYKDPKYSDLPSYPGFIERWVEGVPTRLKLSDKDAKKLGGAQSDNVPF